jgi:hypothetical protein
LRGVANAADGAILAKCLYGLIEQHELAARLVEDLVSNIRTHETSKTLGRGYGLHAALNRYAPMLKNQKFEEEREWRIISRPTMASSFAFRKGRSSVIPYLKLPFDRAVIKRVVIGPTPDRKRSEHAIRTFLVRHEMNDVKIDHSAAPYRNW